MIYDSRMVSLISYFGFVLALTFGLISVSYSATYEGQWTKIILDKVNLDSLDLRGTAVLKGNELATQTHSVKIPLSATRIATLAKGFARGGIYGIVLDQAMTAAGWVWDDILRNWKKTIVVPPPPVLGNLGYCPNPLSGYGDGFFGMGTYTVFECFIGYMPVSCLCVSPYINHIQCQKETSIVDGFNRVRYISVCHYSSPAPGPTTVVTPATPKDIFDDGVKPNPDNTVRLVTGLPNVLNTPSQTMAKPGSVPMIHWPDIATILNELVKAINDAKALFDAVAQAIRDGVNSLSPDQVTHLTNNDIDISTLIQAINNVTNNLTLTPAQQAVLDKYTEKQTTTTITATAPTGSTEITIPTDCDLIPFVCTWLTWFKGWLTDDPPPIPDVIIPIKDLDGFEPMPTDTTGSCPSPYQYSLFGKPYQLSFQPWCDLAVMISYLVIASAWLFASYIVLRVK